MDSGARLDSIKIQGLVIPQLPATVDQVWGAETPEDKHLWCSQNQLGIYRCALEPKGLLSSWVGKNTGKLWS